MAEPLDPTELHDEAAIQVGQVLDGYLADLEAGRAVSRQELLDAHPELAERLEACLAGIEFLHGEQRSTRPKPARGLSART